MDIFNTYRAPVVVQGPTLFQRAGSRLLQWLLAGWNASATASDERYLANAADMNELERRLQAVDRGDAHPSHRLWA